MDQSQTKTHQPHAPLWTTDQKSEREAMEELLTKQIKRQLQPLKPNPLRTQAPTLREDPSQF